MGIDVHGLNLLRIAAMNGGLGRVATLGRQRLYLSHARIRRLLHTEQAFHCGDFCEELLHSHLGATVVHSFDASDYEQATHICDMNEPITAGAAYDTVFDGGFLEHIYNVPQALRNISDLCAPGGQILHILPANNYCGHGFWQFSPELFFSLYSPAHGYVETRVFLAKMSGQRYWYDVTKPSEGQRVSVTSKSPVSVLVRTRRGTTYSHDGVQQSDYVHVWSKRRTSAGSQAVERISPGSQAVERIKVWVRKSPWLPWARLLRDRWTRISRPTTRLSSRNPYLIKRRVDGILRDTVSELNHHPPGVVSAE